MQIKTWEDFEMVACGNCRVRDFANCRYGCCNVRPSDGEDD